MSINITWASNAENGIWKLGTGRGNYQCKVLFSEEKSLHIFGHIYKCTLAVNLPKPSYFISLESDMLYKAQIGRARPTRRMPLMRDKTHSLREWHDDRQKI